MKEIKEQIRKVMLVLIVLHFASCDSVYDYTYIVTNNTESKILIKAKTIWVDSIYSVNVNETKQLFKLDHGIEGMNGPYFDNVANDLEKFIILELVKNENNIDTIVSKKDYLDDSSWNYHNGLYSAMVESIEFDETRRSNNGS